MPDHDPRAQRLGALLSDRYELMEFLGQGGFAAVYLARSRSLDRREALKVLLASHEDDPDFSTRFQQEARVAASLDHPNIVRVYDFGNVEEFFWYSMQFVDGPTLSKALKNGPLDERGTAAMAAPLCDALAYAHGLGIVHRDVKPDNVILGPTGRPILMDFGIAKSENSLLKTQSALILGSPAFLSPEQVKGEPPDGRSDTYALGVTLYQMVSGKRPFVANDRTMLMIMRLREDPIPLATARPGVDPRFAALVMRCLAREKEGRPTALELRDLLLSYLDETGGLPLAARLSSDASAPSHSGAAHRPLPTAVTASETAPTAALRSGPPPVPPAPPLPTAVTALGAPSPAATVAVAQVGATVAVPPSAPASLPAATRSRVPLALGIAASAVVVTLLAVRLLPRRESLPPATPAPTALPLPTQAPAPLPTQAPAPPATPAPATPVPATPVAATPRPTPARVAERATRTVREEPPPPVRRAAVPPEVVEQVPVKLPSDVAAEYAGKSTGLKVTVGEDGAIRSAKVSIPVEPRCDACDQAALEAVRRFRFTPAKDRAGQPVEYTFGVAVRF